MNDNRTKLQKEFEELTPTILAKGISPKEYLQTYCAYLELKLEKNQVENKDMKQYLIDSDKYGVDSETLKARAEQYKHSLKK
jgi:hypothetical protein